MRVAAYIRVSTDEQADKGNSLTEQTERLQAYSRAMGWSVPKFFTDDGYSAKDMKRPAVKKLLERIEKNEFDIVLTSKLDRMSRNLLDVLQFVKMLGSHDCNFVSASEQFDTSTATGRMVLQLLGTFAEFERERNSERVKDNMNSLARNTDKALTQPCYGYDIIEGKYSINQDEAIFVNQMFDLAEQGYGYRTIAKSLNDNGSITKRGKAWDSINVKRLILNTTVAGCRIHNMREVKNGKTIIRPKSEWIISENNHPAIIDPDRYQSVLEILQNRKPARKHADNETYLLTGLIRCGHCGATLQGNTARVRRGAKSYDYFRYVCSTYVKKGGCKYHAVHRDDMESAILKTIRAVSEADEAMLELNVAASPIDRDELQELESQLAKIDRRMQKQIDAYNDDLISSHDLKTASAKAEKERNNIAALLEQALKKKPSVAAVQLKARRLLEEIESVDRVKAKNAIRQLISDVELLNGETASITWKT